MKKLITIIMAICFTLLIAGCSSTNKTALTKDNLNDYLVIHTTISDFCSTEDIYEISYIDTNIVLNCNINVFTSKKKNCNFENVKIEFSVSLNNHSFIISSKMNTLNLDYEGQSYCTINCHNTVYTYTSVDFPSTSDVKITLKSVSGYVVE